MRPVRTSVALLAVALVTYSLAWAGQPAVQSEEVFRYPEAKHGPRWEIVGTVGEEVFRYPEAKHGKGELKYVGGLPFSPSRGPRRKWGSRSPCWAFGRRRG